MFDGPPSEAPGPPAPPLGECAGPLVMDEQVRRGLPPTQDQPIAEEGHQDGAKDHQQLLGGKGRHRGRDLQDGGQDSLRDPTEEIHPSTPQAFRRPESDSDRSSIPPPVSASSRGRQLRRGGRRGSWRQVDRDARHAHRRRRQAARHCRKGGGGGAAVRVGGCPFDSRPIMPRREGIPASQGDERWATSEQEGPQRRLRLLARLSAPFPCQRNRQGSAAPQVRPARGRLGVWTTAADRRPLCGYKLLAAGLTESSRIKNLGVMGRPRSRSSSTNPRAVPARSALLPSRKA